MGKEIRKPQGTQRNTEKNKVSPVFLGVPRGHRFFKRRSLPVISLGSSIPVFPESRDGERKSTVSRQRNS